MLDVVLAAHTDIPWMANWVLRCRILPPPDPVYCVQQLSGSGDWPLGKRTKTATDLRAEFEECQSNLLVSRDISQLRKLYRFEAIIFYWSVLKCFCTKSTNFVFCTKMYSKWNETTMAGEEQAFAKAMTADSGAFRKHRLTRRFTENIVTTCGIAVWTVINLHFCVITAARGGGKHAHNVRSQNIQ